MAILKEENRWLCGQVSEGVSEWVNGWTAKGGKELRINVPSPMFV